MKAITAKYVLLDGHWYENRVIIIKDGVISGVETLEGAEQIGNVQDLGDSYLAPGFFDIQVNGGGGVLLNDYPTLEGLKTVAAAHRRFGTTSLLPTLISDSWEVMATMAQTIETALEQEIPGIRGIHFEGPYLQSDKKGIHNIEHIRGAEEKFLDLISKHKMGAVLVTLAPETVSPDFIKALIDADVVVSAGHTTANYQQTKSAMAVGLNGFTHLYNAMPPFLSREPGVIGAALEGSAGFCSLIVDGHHVHPATLKAAIAAKPDEKMILITDAMPPVGSDQTSFMIGERKIEVSSNRCQASDGTLAGSCISMEDAVRNSVKLLDLPLKKAVGMASTNPAKFMGLENEIGHITVGNVAEFVVLSKSGDIKAVLGSENL